MLPHGPYAKTAAPMLCETLSLRSSQDVPKIAARLSLRFADPTRSLLGIGELLLNAIEHGMLGIGYETKSQLLAKGRWMEEIIRRETLPEHTNKQVNATVEVYDFGTYLTITDPGDGFAWQDYLCISDARKLHPHGRGIAQAKALSFDWLRYEPPGNQVIAFAGRQQVMR